LGEKEKSSKFEITLFYVKNGNSYQGYGLMSDIVAYINTENLSSF
jgi:C-terminal processing protease CtpA/Prc